MVTRGDLFLRTESAPVVEHAISFDMQLNRCWIALVTQQKKRLVAAVFLVAIASGFTSFMLFFGGAFAGAGHGTYFFGYIVAGPFGAGLAIWPLIAGMLPWRRKRPAAVALLVASIIPLIWAGYAYTHLGDEMDYFLKVWNRLKPLPLVFLITFCVPSIIGTVASIKHAFPKRETVSGTETPAQSNSLDTQ
jgi:hypothetical protein